ncbi:MAG TPA: amino acid adenylation domain-containing protein [Bryobacteraceae bacterium]|nr:amino acid adenylation domain-containing protein [Bryobacteraceae bacterium]
MSRRLQDALTASAERHPEKTAVVFRNQRMTYGEWEQASNRLAHALRKAGCVKGDRVGLLLPKSLEILIGMFGALKADCIYVPLDTSSPGARLARILEAADCRCVLALHSAAPLLGDLLRSSIKVGWMDEGGEASQNESVAFSWPEVQSLSAEPVPSSSTEEDIAHLLFTSGTTGAPKGVMITHSNVQHFLDWAVPYFGIESSDRISAHPPFHFDLSTFDIHGTVRAGAELHLVPPELNLLPSRLAGFIRDSNLTQWFSVPSILTHMAKSDAVRQNDFPALKRLLWCGEKFPTPGLIYWMKRLPGVGFFNLYGPTEATIASSFYKVPACPSDETAETPIGEPCAGERLLVLDEKLRPVAPEEPGDLYIGGVGLSPGYWRDPARTAEVFVQDPATPGPEGRIYRTGDLARWTKAGELCLLGRSDSQIKSRGYRIELGEIEAALHSLPGIQTAAVVAIDSSAFEGTTICCAWVSAEGRKDNPAELRRSLSKLVPNYMIPSRWMPLERMPLNGNGKTDRRYLKEKFLELAANAESHMQRPLGVRSAAATTQEAL